MLLDDLAPSFILKDKDGKEVSITEISSKFTVIYFYPKDSTPGCTKEACTIRDNYESFQKMDITVLGVSTDSVRSHAKFAEKYTLPFTLLADEDKVVVAAYEVWTKKKFMGREYMGVLRVSYLIDPMGKIAKVYEEVKPADHAEEVLKDAKELA